MNRQPIAFLEYINNVPLDDFVYISECPLIEKGYKISATKYYLGKYHNLSLATKDDVAIGSIELCRKFFEQIDVQIPNYLGYPPSIYKYLKREIYKCKLQEINTFPIFVKPANDVKLFTGVVLNRKEDIELLKLANPSVQNNTEIYCSEIIEIDSEYRVFVHTKPDKFLIKDKIVGIKHYNGDFKLFPSLNDFNKINQIIEEYKEDSPICYSLDIGLNKTQSSFYLIEVNDFWGLCSYGLDGKTYVKMTLDRFKEIKWR